MKMEKRGIFMILFLCIQFTVRELFASNSSSGMIDSSYQPFLSTAAKLKAGIPTTSLALSSRHGTKTLFSVTKSLSNLDELLKSELKHAAKPSNTIRSSMSTSTEQGDTTLVYPSLINYSPSIYLSKQSFIFNMNKSLLTSKTPEKTLILSQWHGQFKSFKSEISPRLDITSSSFLSSTSARKISVNGYYTKTTNLTMESTPHTFIRPSVSPSNLDAAGKQNSGSTAKLNHTTGHLESVYKDATTSINSSSLAPYLSIMSLNITHASFLESVSNKNISLMLTTFLPNQLFTSFILHSTSLNSFTTENNQIHNLISSSKAIITTYPSSASSTQKLTTNYLQSSTHTVSSSLPNKYITTKTSSKNMKKTSTSSSILPTKTKYDITIPKQKTKQGIPAWIIIMTAASAFLAITVITAVAFKFVKWNKDHGDYTLWVSNMELQPINSRNAELLT